MIRTALAVLLMLPGMEASAEDVTRKEWGVSAKGPCVLTLVPCESGCWARVEFENVVIGLPTPQIGPEVFTLTLAGMDVIVTVRPGGGHIPEIMLVTPPYGFTADPGELVVDDDTTGVVFIMPALIG